MYMNAGEWLEIVRKEYLADFIHKGGAAVKFIVPKEQPDCSVLQQELRRIAESEGYQFASIDAARTPVHMIDHVFHKVAGDVDWDDLALSFMSDILVQNGFLIPAQREDFQLRKIAELNNRPENLFGTSFDTLLQKNLFYDYHMCQEFRIAMIRLCQAIIDTNGPSPVTPETIKDWLQGNLRHIAEVKPALIFQKIARHNARHMLSSLSYWLHLAGKSGLVIAIDISRCLMRRPKPRDTNDDSRYYSIGTTLDTYEALRQFVDATDEMEFCFIVVAAPPEFLHPDERRGVHRYDALKLRIWDEVRDKNRVNPLSSLIRLSPCPDIGTVLSKERQ
jgi:hypothetical protein